MQTKRRGQEREARVETRDGFELEGGENEASRQEGLREAAPCDRVR